MTVSLWRQHILPFLFGVGLLALATLAGDYYLHRLNLVWIGRYLGILGALLIIASLSYSLRKRKYLAIGNPRAFLSFHEFTAWLGSWFVLLHAGVHFNAVLPWLATVAMGVNVVSGLVGKLLLARSRRHLQNQREHYQSRGMTPPEIEKAVFWDAIVLGVMTRWRKIHIPIFIIFVTLALGHIIGIFLFWGWA